MPVGPFFHDAEVGLNEATERQEWRIAVDLNFDTVRAYEAVGADRVASVIRQVSENKVQAFQCGWPPLIQKGMHVTGAFGDEFVAQLHLGGEDFIPDQPIFQQNGLHPRQTPQGRVHPGWTYRH